MTQSSSFLQLHFWVEETFIAFSEPASICLISPRFGRFVLGFRLSFNLGRALSMLSSSNQFRGENLMQENLFEQETDSYSLLTSIVHSCLEFATFFF